MKKIYKLLFFALIANVFQTANAQCNLLTYSQTPSNNGCSFDYISNVSFSTINRNSTCDNYTMVSTPNPTLTQGLSYVLSITTGGDVEGVRAWIDYNIDGTFTNTSPELVLGPSFANTNPATYTVLVTIPMTSSLGATRLRTRCRYNGAPADATSIESYGETEDYCITIAGSPACSGTPTVPAVSLSGATGCPSSIYTISATTNTGTGISYQWQSSASSSGPFSSISGATTAVLSSTAAANIFYQMITTCANGSGTVATAVIGYTLADPGPCICNTYGASFPSNAGDEDIYLVSFGTLNNASTCTTVASGAGSIANRYSNYTGVVTAPTVCRGSSTNYTVNVGSCSTSFYGVSTAIYIDYNQNGVFTDPGELAMGNNTSFTTFINPVTSGSAIAVYTGSITIPSTASLGVTRMRVITLEQTTVPTSTGTPAFSYGETEDYCINIIGPSTIAVAGSASICTGQQYIITPTGATSYTYVSASSTLTGLSATVSPVVATNYTVNYTSSNGCVVTGTNAPVVSVTALTSPTVSVNSGAICSGNSFTIVPSGASTYTISGGSSVVSPTSNASYNVTGTSSLGCVSSNTAVSSITVNALPTVSVNSGNICIGNSFTIVPSGASTYTFISGAAVVTPTANANYSVTGTSSLGCVSSNTAVSSVTVNALPTVSVNSGAVCAGNSFTIVPTGASTYSYSSGSAVVTPTANANYSVTGTSSVGCVSSNTAVSSVTVNALPTVNAVSNTSLLCVGQTASLTASGATTYTWNTSANTSVIAISPSVTTTYTVNGTNATGCNNVTTITQSVSACTGISNLSSNISNLSFLVYPNPSNGFYTIEVSSTLNVSIIDALGKVVYNQQLQDGKHSINLTNLNNGLYILKVESNGTVKTVRLIKD